MSLYWIANSERFRLAIASRPRGGDWLCDELRALTAERLDVLVSMLTKAEADELGLSNEAHECHSANVEFLNFPIEDRSIPLLNDQFIAFVDNLATYLARGRSVAVHCRAGIGRSAVLVACLLVRFGVCPEEAFKSIQDARRCPVPDTEEQVIFVKRFAAGQK